VLAGIPVTLNGHKGLRFHYRVAGSLGVQGFQEDSTPFFPLDPAIQAANGNQFYPEQTSVGANYSLNAEAAYAVSEHWYAGGYFNFNNTRNYATEEVGFFVRYLIRPQHAKEETGPTGVFPTAGFRPLKVP
jgi:cellulose synthase operon protein C